MTWIVQCLGDIDKPRDQYELSVIRSDNAHGRRSWGWGDENKIILFGTGLGGNDLNPRTPEQIERARLVADILCGQLNLLDADT